MLNTVRIQSCSCFGIYVCLNDSFECNSFVTRPSKTGDTDRCLGESGDTDRCLGESGDIDRCWVSLVTLTGVWASLVTLTGVWVSLVSCGASISSTSVLQTGFVSLAQQNTHPLPIMYIVVLVTCQCQNQDYIITLFVVNTIQTIKI